MTENKRFMIDDAGTLIDIQTREMYDIVEEVCPVLNALYNENEQLKEAVWSWSNSYNRVYQENQQLKNLIQHTYQLERTELGRNVLKQLLDQME